MEEFMIIYKELNEKYNKHRLRKEELAKELGVSVSIINQRLALGINLPEYQKGEGRNAVVYFTTFAIAKYLSKTIKVYN